MSFIVPTMSAIYNSLKTMSVAKTERPSDLVLRFLTDGLELQVNQYVVLSTNTFIRLTLIIRRKIRSLQVQYSHHQLAATEQELSKRKSKLDSALEEFRVLQATVMPNISAVISSRLDQEKRPEEEALYLPSDFTAAERVKFDLVHLANIESKLREGQANDWIAFVQNVVRKIGTMLLYKQKHYRGEAMNTRATSNLLEAHIRRDEGIQNYNAARQALIDLGVTDGSESSSFPHLMPHDTFRKAVDRRRKTGDSRRMDGGLWTLGAAAKMMSEKAEPGNDLPVGVNDPASEPIEKCKFFGDTYPLVLLT